MESKNPRGPCEPISLHTCIQKSNLSGDPFPLKCRLESVSSSGTNLLICLIPFPTGMEYKEEEITGTHIIIAIFSFFSIALGNSCSLDLTLFNLTLSTYQKNV